MKKLYIIGLMLSLCTAAFAQKSGRDVLDDLEKLEIPKKNVVAVSDNNIFEFKVFSHIGYGFNIARSNDFAPRKGRSGSLFVNLVNINIFPIQWVGLEAGIDIAYNFFTTQENLFMIDNDRNVKVMKFSDLTSLTLPGEAIDRNRSKLSYGSMNVPVLLKGRWKHLEMGLGAELVWNWKGGTSYSYRQANTSTGISQNKGTLKSLTYNLMATLSYGGFGVFFKYYPAAHPVLPDGGVDLRYWTVGVAFGF